jgi:multicomponent Na+:H+ antiporter subunit D
MRATLVGLGAACVSFGVLPGLVVDRVAAPAVSTLLHPAEYARGVLARVGDVPASAVSFSYGNVGDLLVAALTVVLGVALAIAYLRMPEPAPIRLLRAVHTGSVNDYAVLAIACLILGEVVVVI